MLSAFLTFLLLLSDARTLTGELLAKIDSAAVFEARREERLDSLREVFGQTSPVSLERYETAMKMGAEYSGFVADSAVIWYDRAAGVAQGLGRDDFYDTAMLSKAGKLNSAGFFFEAFRIIDAIPLSRLSREGRTHYYRQLSGLYHSLYMSHPRGSAYRAEFIEIYKQYSDSLLRYLDPSSEAYLREMEKRAGRAGNFEEALRINNLRLTPDLHRLSDGYALVMYDRNAIYRNYMHRPLEEHIEELFEAAMSDVCCANRNSAAIRFVELYLVSENQIADARRVSSYYYSSLVKYGSRTRLLEGLGVSMRVNNEYAQVLRRQNRIVTGALWLLGGMFCVIFFVLAVLILYSRRIRRLNVQLDHSNKVARGYILGFFDLYSANMARLQSLRSRINVKLRRGDTDYILALTDPSKDITGEELRELYDHFDEAFLGIYPNFVEQFNAMLRPEERITLKKDEKLNMELRIFAVVKLGISDPAQIAQILHCSIKTVYNKRSEINGKLSVPREKFSDFIAAI